MNTKFIKWIIPIILELFKSTDRYPGYFKRNKTIALLLIASLSCMGLVLYMYEQAVAHGVKSLANEAVLKDTKEKYEECRIVASQRKSCE